MEPTKRGRKQVNEAGDPPRRRGPAVTGGARTGELKGKPVDGRERSGLAKAPVEAGRRFAARAERDEMGRGELPLPPERGAPIERSDDRSLRLRLLVEGERITVLDAAEVDVPAPLPERVRGSDFLEVRAGDRVLALQRLVDPGVAIGIPDPRDTGEFRGHREMPLESYELTVRVPVGALDALISRGDEATRREGDEPTIEIALVHAPEHVEIEPRRLDADRRAGGLRLEPRASTGRLRVEELRGATYGDARRKRPDAEDPDAERQ